MTSLSNIGVGSDVAAITHTEEVANWLKEIEEAKKREKNYRQEAQRCVELYEADANVGADKRAPYNILYANTETLSPALYNSTPRPVVSPRFKGKEDKAKTKVAARVLQRTLEFLVDANQADYSPFDDLQKSAVLEALVPGRGLARFRYEPTIASIPPSQDDLAANAQATPTDRLDYETVCGEEVGWNRVLMGYAMRWSQVPWLGYEHYMTKEECIANFGKEKAAGITMTAVKEDGDKPNQQPSDAKGVKFAHIWEIWDKETKRVIFISDGAKEAIKVVDDPLKLSGFFNTPRPMTFLPKISSMIPQPLYLMYETQAKELNDVTLRIRALIKGMKVRGFYDATIKGLDDLMKKDDNVILPATGVAALQQGQSLENSIWLMPLEKHITVVQQLYVNRQQVKSVIYEITGIADILRGSSQASETLGAQKMKEAWGTMRLKRMQKEVQRYAKDCLRLMAEIACKNFNPQTFAAMTGIELPDAQAKAQAQQFLAQAQQPPQQIPGQPPAPAPDPQMMEQAQKLLELPTWDEVVSMLRDDLHRNYSIDIETNSTIDAEATEDKEQVAEFMNAMSQLLNGLGPLVEKGFMPFEVAKSLLLAVTKRFRFGTEVEDDLKSMKPPPAQGSAPDPKAQAEAAKIQQETQQAAQLHEQAMATAQQDAQLHERENQAKMHQLALEMQLATAKFQAMMAKLGADSQIAKTKVIVAHDTAQAAVEVNAARVKTANAPKPAPAGKA